MGDSERQGPVQKEPVRLLGTAGQQADVPSHRCFGTRAECRGRKQGGKRGAPSAWELQRVGRAMHITGTGRTGSMLPNSCIGVGAVTEAAGGEVGGGVPALGRSLGEASAMGVSGRGGEGRRGHRPGCEDGPPGPGAGLSQT